MKATPLALADCERVRDGPIGQPVNTLSSLAYVGAGAALAARSRRSSPHDRARLLTFAAVTAANGLGGVAYHGPGGALSRWGHDVALLATLGVIAVTDVEDLMVRRRSEPRALGVAVVSAVVALSPAASARAQLALGAGALAAEAAGQRARRRMPRGAATGWRLPPLAATGVAAVAVHALSRTGRPWCRPDAVVQGHAVWHVLTATVLWRWGATRLMTTGAPAVGGRGGTVTPGG